MRQSRGPGALRPPPWPAVRFACATSRSFPGHLRKGRCRPAEPVGFFAHYASGSRPLRCACVLRPLRRCGPAAAVAVPAFGRHRAPAGAPGFFARPLVRRCCGSAGARCPASASGPGFAALRPPSVGGRPCFALPWAVCSAQVAGSPSGCPLSRLRARRLPSGGGRRLSRRSFSLRPPRFCCGAYTSAPLVSSGGGFVPLLGFRRAAG